MVNITFSSHDVRLELGNGSPAFPEDYRNKVDAHWSRINRDGRFFNGPVLAASEFALDGDDPRIALCLTDYAHYLYAAQDTQHVFDCRAAFAAAALLTSDNFLLLGQMAAHTSAPGQIQFPGGGIELSADGQIDARQCCQCEVAEEMGEAFFCDVARFAPLGFKCGGKLSTVGLFYALSLDLTATQAQTAFAAHQAAERSAGGRPEFDRLHALAFDVSAIDEFVRLQDGSIVDYLAPLLLDGLHEASAALSSSKFA